MTSSSKFKSLKFIVSSLILGVLILGMAGFFDEKLSPGVQDIEYVNSDVTDRYALKMMTEPEFEFVNATTSARQNTVIASRIIARTNKVLVKAGQKISKNELLVALENDDLISRYEQAQEELASVNAFLTESEKSLYRAKELFNKGLVSAAKYETAQSDFDAKSASFRNAQKRVQEAKTQLAFAEIRSPIDGVVVDRLVEPGDMATPAQPLLKIFNPDSIRVEANVREGLINSLELNHVIEFDVPAIGLTNKSTIEEIVPQGNSASRSFLVKTAAIVDEKLLPGMYAKVKILLPPVNKLKVPTSFVSWVGQLSLVQVETVNSSGQPVYERRYVRVGAEDLNGFVEVYSGLKAGEVLVR